MVNFSIANWHFTLLDFVFFRKVIFIWERVPISWWKLWKGSDLRREEMERLKGSLFWFSISQTLIKPSLNLFSYWNWMKLSLLTLFLYAQMKEKINEEMLHRPSLVLSLDQLTFNLIRSPSSAYIYSCILLYTIFLI